MLITSNFSSNFAALLYGDISALVTGRAAGGLPCLGHGIRPVKDKGGFRMAARAHPRHVQHAAAQRRAGTKDTSN
jgi:hypothetical protein